MSQDLDLVLHSRPNYSTKQIAGLGRQSRELMNWFHATHKYVNELMPEIFFLSLLGGGCGSICYLS